MGAVPQYQNSPTCRQASRLVGLIPVDLSCEAIPLRIDVDLSWEYHFYVPRIELLGEALYGEYMELRSYPNT